MCAPTSIAAVKRKLRTLRVRVEVRGDATGLTGPPAANGSGIGLNSNSPSPSIQPAIRELERWYGDVLPIFVNVANFTEQRPTIVVQSRGRRKQVLGWTAPKRWTCGEATHNEITLCAETLNRGAEAAFGTLVHEMVHHVNHLRGISDCSPNQYHRRAFKDLAEQVGLVVTKDGWHGFSHTGTRPRAARGRSPAPAGRAGIRHLPQPANLNRPGFPGKLIT